MEQKTDKKNKDLDQAWKQIIRELFPQFIEFFFPKLYPQIDFEKKWDFLEQEQSQIFPESEIHKGAVDSLVKVFLKDETEKWVLIHVEVQGQKGKEDFGERMFKYFYRIKDRFNKEITALAILTDNNASFMPMIYIYEFDDTILFYIFKIYKVIEQSEEILLKGTNIFSLVVLSVLKVMGVNDELQQKSYKKELMKILLKSGKNREEIIRVLTFLDYLIVLPKELNEQLKEEIKKEGDKEMEEVRLMSFIEAEGYERGEAIGEARGEARGEAKGKLETLIMTAKKMFEYGLPIQQIALITGFSEYEIERL